MVNEKSAMTATALADCSRIARNRPPFGGGGISASTFSDDPTDLIRNTIQAPQPIVNGVSLYIPDVASQPLMGCGYVDPTAAPYNADPTGVKDSTAAIHECLCRGAECAGVRRQLWHLCQRFRTGWHDGSGSACAHAGGDHAPGSDDECDRARE